VAGSTGLARCRRVYCRGRSVELDEMSAKVEVHLRLEHDIRQPQLDLVDEVGPFADGEAHQGFFLFLASLLPPSFRVR